MVEKPLCVLLDTNTWRKNLLLRTAMGSALLYTLKAGNHKLGLPEVIEEEVYKHTESAAFEAREKIERNFRDIQAIIGSHSPYRLPDDVNVRKSITDRFNEFDELLVRVPFTLDHARSAMQRVNQKLPPSSTKQQQYKDCAIWEAVLELGKQYNIYLVSSDGDFYKDNRRLELNSILSTEAEQFGVFIAVFDGIDKCIASLEKDRPDIESSKLAELIFKAIDIEISRTASNNNLRLTHLESYETSAFITENYKKLAVDYELVVDAVNTVTNELNEGEPASLTVEGTCTFDIEKYSVENNSFGTIGLSWVGTDGVRKLSKSVHLTAGTAYSGSGPDVPYSTRRSID